MTPWQHFHIHQNYGSLVSHTDVNDTILRYLLEKNILTIREVMYLTSSWETSVSCCYIQIPVSLVLLPADSDLGGSRLPCKCYSQAGKWQDTPCGSQVNEPAVNSTLLENTIQNMYPGYVGIFLKSGSRARYFQSAAGTKELA